MLDTMTLYEQVRIAVYVFGLPTIGLLLVRAVRKTREIRALHEKLRAEEAASPIKDPYAALAESYGSKR